MTLSIRLQVESRGITRLCHFTQARNLPHILDEGYLRSTTALEDRGLPFNPNDQERIEGHTDCVCCSIEYPNAWFMARAEAKELLFHDWVVITIDPRFLWEAGTRFSPVNAATGGGRYIADGPAAFEQLYDLSPPGSRVQRSMLHLDSCPTDNQAEALIGVPIPTHSFISLVFETGEKAAAEWARLEQLGMADADLPLVVCPTFFHPHDLASHIRTGEHPDERVWSPPVGSSVRHAQ